MSFNWESFGFVAWFVFVVFLVTIFAGERFATGFIALVLLSMIVLNGDRVAALINDSFPKG